MANLQRVILTRHFNVRCHQTWEADVPIEMLDRLEDDDVEWDRYITEDGDLTHEDIEFGIDDEDLNFDITRGPLVESC